MKQILTMDTPIGRIGLIGEGDALLRLLLPGEPVPEGLECKKTPVLLEAERQLEAYFAGTLRTFSVPLQLNGTPFQRAVWHALEAIPYGETRSYAQIAEAVNRPKACRAVGGANHVNPVPILIPCHRVIGAHGALTGYGGGLEIKAQLLDFEARQAR